MGESLLLENCGVYDVRTGKTAKRSSVLVRDGRIELVGPAAEVAAAWAAPEPAKRGRASAATVVEHVRRIDLRGATVLPGLVNCHVHFGLVLPGTEGDKLRGESESALALRMAANARAALRCGITTVRLVGERPYADLALRSSIARGETEGPRILTAGPLIVCTGGHGWDIPGSVEADGADGLRRAARAQLKHGVDWVKIAISGGIAGQNEAIRDAQLTRDEMLAVTDVAHSWGKKVAAHAGPPAAIRTAVECGIDSIEHGYFLTREVCDFMAERGTWLVPTVNVSRASEFYKKIGAPPWMVKKALESGKLHFAALQHAIAAGVNIALGTDMMPDEPFDGTNVTVRELEFYAEAGMSPAEAVRAGTIRAAELLGLEREIGAVEAGYAADLIAVHGDPAKSVSALRELQLVVRGGSIVPGV